jgi:putative lipoic acid-binding regulatory protein
VSEEPQEVLTFPTDYPVKVLGRPSPEFRTRVHAIVLKHVPETPSDRVSERLSENGNFISISYNLHMHSREQVVALVNELSACDLVMMVL